MFNFRRAVLTAAALLPALVAVPAVAHEGNADYRSTVREIVPPTDGLTAQVLDHDDALLAINRSDRTVTLLGEDGEPFARLLADGTVQVDKAALASVEAAAEDEPDDHAGIDGRLLASLDGAALAHAGHDHEEPGQVRRQGEAPAPRWTTLDRTGRFQWHDARIRHSGAGLPPQVTDREQETKVNDWRVPIVVGGDRGAILGTLTWVGEPGAGSSFPVAAVVSLAVLALLAVAAVVLVRRRRGAGEGVA